MYVESDVTYYEMQYSLVEGAVQESIHNTQRVRTVSLTIDIVYQRNDEMVFGGTCPWCDSAKEGARQL